MGSVMAAGDALQLRELVDHAALQVVLRQHRGAPGQRRIHADLRGDRLGQRGDPRHLVGHAAQPGLVGDRLQAVAHRGKPLLQVFVEEELGVGEARADHALVALADLRRAPGRDVGDADEVLGEPAAGIQYREEFLVGLHGRDQRFLRHRQELALECAGHRDRPFVEAVDLLQVVRVDARAAAGGLGRGLDLGDDARAALVGIDQHVGCAQRLDVGGRRGDRHVAAVQEAMPAAGAAGADAQRLERDHLVAEQRDQPVQRAGEAVGMVAPAHRFGDRHPGQGVVQHALQEVEGARARGHRAMHEALALGVGGCLQRGPVHPGLGGEAFQRLGRLAFGVQRDVEVGAQHFAALFRLLGGDARQQHRDPAWRVQRLGNAAFDGNAALLQCDDHAIKERLRESGQRLDGQFLGAEFDQQRLHAHAATSCCMAGCFRPGNPSFSRCAKYASATACASLRTRRM